jgi:hypothetical protein
MFVDEGRYFFDCIEAGVPPAPDVMEAAESVRIATLAVQERTR